MKPQYGVLRRSSLRITFGNTPAKRKSIEPPEEDCTLIGTFDTLEEAKKVCQQYLASGTTTFYYEVILILGRPQVSVTYNWSF